MIVCFNVVLAKFLKQIIPYPKQVDVFNFHGLCIDFCKKANLDITIPDPHVDQRLFFKNELPDSLLDALSLIDDRYDALIVDEGQDMGPQAFKLIRKMVPEGPNDLFIVGDAHQRIYKHNKDQIKLRP